MGAAIPVLNTIGVSNSAGVAFSFIYFVNEVCYTFFS